MSATLEYPVEMPGWLPVPAASDALNDEDLGAWFVAAGEALFARGATQDAAERGVRGLAHHVPAPEGRDRCVYLTALGPGFVPVEFDVEPFEEGWRAALVARWTAHTPAEATLEIDDVEIEGWEQGVRLSSSLVRDGRFAASFGWAGVQAGHVVRATALCANPVLAGEAAHAVPAFMARIRLVPS